MLAYVGFDSLESRSLAAAGKNRSSINRVSSQVLGASLTDGSVSFEHQAERVEARMTAGATRVLPVFDQHFPQRQIQLCLIVGQYWHRSRRRRDGLAKHTPDYPVSALHRTGPQPG